jgi:hypothetical protein
MRIHISAWWLSSWRQLPFLALTAVAVGGRDEESGACLIMQDLRSFSPARSSVASTHDVRRHKRHSAVNQFCKRVKRDCQEVLLQGCLKTQILSVNSREGPGALPPARVSPSTRGAICSLRPS